MWDYILQRPSAIFSLILFLIFHLIFMKLLNAKPLRFLVAVINIPISLSLGTNLILASRMIASHLLRIESLFYRMTNILQIDISFSHLRIIYICFLFLPTGDIFFILLRLSCLFNHNNNILLLSFYIFNEVIHVRFY